ncbi:MAG: outer membrane lipoprotein-sorting protein [Candidatus Binatia bacterium]
MKTRHAMLCLVMAGLGGAAAAVAQTPAEDARGLVQRVSDTQPTDAYQFRMTLTTPGGLEREFTLSGKDLPNDIDARYLEVTGPFNLKDTRYLFYDRNERRDDQFVYLPFMKRIVRLSDKTRREPFLASTFYVNDIIEPAIDDFTYRFVGDAVVKQRNCRLVESLPKDPEHETYSKSIMAIDPIDLVVMRAELFDRNDKLLKVHTIETLEKIDGFWTPRKQVMHNVQDDETSELDTVEVQYHAPLGDEIFREAHLGR